MAHATILRLYHLEPLVTTLGPGRRAGLWVQGCRIGCPGCLVPDSHDPNAGDEVAVDGLIDRLVALPAIEGLTVSGGEPFDQAPALRALLEGLRERRSDLSLMLYSGYRRERLEDQADGRAILAQADILVDGPFVVAEQSPDPWRGSTNQRIHFLSDRYGARDHAAAPLDGLEFLVRRNGAFFMAGIPAPGVWEAVHQRLGAPSAAPGEFADGGRAAGPIAGADGTRNSTT
ncbi:MAG: radical SAM protein [Candidatus Competibacteraceae bacterium]|nr:MAG: radical SAM protein [Candidatus Competibacteraceae bacterium]